MNELKVRKTKADVLEPNSQFDPNRRSYPQKETSAMRAPGTGEKAEANAPYYIRYMETLDEVLTEKKKKRDRCLKIADRKFDKPSAYKSGAVVRCRKGDIWKGVKEAVVDQLTEDESLRKWFKRSGPSGKQGGWVDCNTGRKDSKTGKMKYKACGRAKGEKRAKYPKTVILIFASGKLVCVGAKLEKEVYRSVNNVHSLLEEKDLMVYD